MVVVNVEDRDLFVALVEERLGGDGGVVEVAVAAHQVARGVVSRWSAQGEGAVGTGLDGCLCGQGDLCSAIGCLPGAGGDRSAAIETVVTELAVQAGGLDCAQGAGGPGVGQQIAVGVELGPARPGALEEVQVVAAVDARDRLKAEVLGRLDRPQVLLLHPCQHVVGA